MRRILSGLFLFFGAIILLSAVLSPWAFWTWDNFFPGADPFRRVFNRVLMISAVALLWPLASYWSIRRWEDLGIGRFKLIKKELAVWFAWGIFTIGLLFLTQMLTGERGWTGVWRVGRIVEFFASAWIVGILEEILFRGLLFLALFQLVREYSAQFWRVSLLTSAFYAVSHYLKSGNPTQAIDWLSGWRSWGLMLQDFSDSRMLALRLVTLFLVGLILCALAYRSKTLWASIGLHAGWVFGLKVLNQATEWKGGSGNWWFQADILSGLSAELLLLAILLFILFRDKTNTAA